jgi:hypothetical protein
LEQVKEDLLDPLNVDDKHLGHARADLKKDLDSFLLTLYLHDVNDGFYLSDYVCLFLIFLELAPLYLEEVE